MIKKTKFKYNIMLIALLCLSSISILAQAEDPWDDGPDPPPAPIDDYIYPMIIIALLAVAYFFYKQKIKDTTINNNL